MGKDGVRKKLKFFFGNMSVLGINVGRRRVGFWVYTVVVRGFFLKLD